MISVHNEISWGALENQIRQVPLQDSEGLEQVLPYENATITLTEIPYAEVRPTTLYVLRSGLEKQAAIARDLARVGLHQLDLTGGLVLRDENDTLIGLIPPIVEQSEKDGVYLLDGAHRASMGRWLGRKSFIGVHITGIREDCPSYAYPNEWDDIRIWEAVPAQEQYKKRYREGDYRKLYRDFGPLNGSRPREA